MANKDWTGNANSIWKTLGASNHTDKERQNEDYYATDPIAAEWLLKIEEIPKDKPIWECAAGEKHLSKVFEENGYKVRSSDIIVRTEGVEQLDFLTSNEKWDGTIISNPPYKCFSSDTECYTKKGWKYIIDVKNDDELLSLNPYTQELEWSGINNKIVRDFNPQKEIMFHFKKSHLDIMCTSEHRMYALQKKNGLLHTKNNDLILSQDIRSYDYIPRTGYKWNGVKKDFFTLPSINGMIYAQPVYKPEIKINMNDWLQFFGLWLADGYCRHTKNVNNNYRKTVGIKQISKNKEMVINILDKLPFKYKILFDNYSNRKNECINFEINNEQLWSYLIQFGYSKDKFVPSEIKELCQQQLNIFINAYFNGDGSVFKLKDGQEYKIYRSISKRLIEDIQEILLKLGYLSHITFSESSSYITNGKKRTQYSLVYNPNSMYNKIFYPSNKNNACRCDYQGKVCCVTLNKNGVFLLRRNKCEYFSGNCAVQFIEKAMESVTEGNKVIMFLKIQFLEGKSRKKLFEKYPPKTVWVSSSRITCAKNGDFEYMKANGGSAVAYGFYVWEKGYKGDTILKWFN